MRSVTVRARLTIALVLVAATGGSASAQFGLSAWLSKLDPPLQQQAALITGRSRVIVRATNGGAVSLLMPVIQLAGGTVGRRLPIVSGLVADLPNTALPA